MGPFRLCVFEAGPLFTCADGFLVRALLEEPMTSRRGPRFTTLKQQLGVMGLLLLITTGCQRTGSTGSRPAGGGPDRTVLPIAEPAAASITEMDARKAKAPERFEVKAPQNAP